MYNGNLKQQRSACQNRKFHTFHLNTGQNDKKSNGREIKTLYKNPQTLRLWRIKVGEIARRKVV